MLQRTPYPGIFQAFNIKSLFLKNRIVMPPIATNFAGQNGEVTDSMVKFYTERARGGTGLIIIENANIDYPLGKNGARQLRIDHERYIPGLTGLVEGVKKYDTAICLQINHAGGTTSNERTEGRGIVGPSDIPAKRGGEIPRSLTIGEIEDIIEKFAQAAKRVQSAGFDAVEIHGGHGYLINQFLSPLMNKREDDFGGSMENRARFFSLVLREIRKNVGDSFPVFTRISADEFIENGNTLNDTLETLQYLCPYVDVLDVSSGVTDSAHTIVDPSSCPEGWRVYLSAEIKKRYPMPTITVGNIRTPEYAEKVLSENKADLIAIGRGLICDPDWVNKVYDGDTIIKCTSCNQGCTTNRIVKNKPITCIVNPNQFDTLYFL